jgi:hypothetical protein
MLQTDPILAALWDTSVDGSTYPILAALWDTSLLFLLVSFPLLVLLSAFAFFDNLIRQRLGLGGGVFAHLDHYMPCLCRELYGIFTDNNIL